MKKFKEYKDQQPYAYPRAGEGAPEGVRESIAKFHRLPEDYKRNTPLLYHLLGSGTPPYKMSKEDAEYQEQPNGDEKCANCRFAFHHVVSDTMICSQMRGEIVGEGWCRLWKGDRR